MDKKIIKGLISALEDVKKGRYTILTTKETIIEQINKAKEQERERILEIIPRTWLDPFMNEWLGKGNLTSKDIEHLLMKIRNKIKESRDNDEG